MSRNDPRYDPLPDISLKFHEYPTGLMYLYIPPQLASQFKELCQRGANLWPDAPPEIKELVDLITNGKVQQDYYKQMGIVRPFGKQQT